MRHARITAAVLTVGAVTALSACGGGGSAASAEKATSSGTAAPARSSSAGAGGASSSAGAPGVAAGGTTTGAHASTSSAGGIGTAVAPAQAKIIQNGTIDLRLSNGTQLRRTFALIGSLASRDGGFVASSAMHSGRHPTASVTVRIPDARAAGAVTAIGTFGRATSTSLTGQDVTGQVVDLAARITNLDSEEKAVRALLAKAGTVRNILNVQGQLFDLQGQIEELTAQRNSLDNRVQYATLRANLTTVTPPPPAAVPPRSTLARFWHLAASHTVATVRGIVLAVGWAAPILILAAIAAAGWLVLRRRRKLPRAEA